jgi:hypothetical protein
MGMKKFKVIFVVDDNGKRRGEVEIKANTSIEASNQVADALKRLNAKNITIVSSNEIK